MSKYNNSVTAIKFKAAYGNLQTAFTALHLTLK